jgi:5'-phosphate synthase pdxT subunit
MDVTVRRNAFGSQVCSFEQGLMFAGIDGPLNALFIRAPIVTEVGSEVEVLAEVEGNVVAVREGQMLGTAFHTELTEDSRVHDFFMRM